MVGPTMAARMPWTHSPRSMDARQAHVLPQLLFYQASCEVAWHQVGKQYYILKEYKKALAAYDFAIISDDTFIGAYLEKGKVLEQLKRYNVTTRQRTGARVRPDLRAPIGEQYNT